jgi:hypothetical protein
MNIAALAAAACFAILSAACGAWGAARENVGAYVICFVCVILAAGFFLYGLPPRP